MHLKRIISTLVFLLAFTIIGGSGLSVTVFAQGPSDAIAIRVVPNPDRLPPISWYRQNVPNPGTPASLLVNGYPAIRDGRTVYVAAANYVASAGQVYSNIYIISHSLSENEKTEAVFTEFLKNFRFNTNIENSEVRDQLRRDMRRANDLEVIKSSLDAFRLQSGLYPIFEGGSYLPNTTYSTWPSWQSTLGNLLGRALPEDPLNKFIGCEDPFDATTCWNQTDLQFACPEEAFVYGYRGTDDGSSYTLLANYEYTGPGSWRESTIQQQSADQCFNVTRTDATDGDEDGVGGGSDNCPLISNPDQADVDGDGIGDACDLCANDPSNDQDNDGVCGNTDNCATIGNPNQTDIDKDGIGDACDFQGCGNNIQEGNEVCDGQSGVGEFQRCSLDCQTITTLSFCGDGRVNTPNDQGLIEECDGNDENIICGELQDGYRTQRSRICRDTCRYSPFTSCQPLESCGDGTINGNEQCDDGELNGAQCSAAYGESCNYCNSICVVETALGARCGDGTVQEGNGEQCDEGPKNGRVCTPPYGKTCEYCGNTCQDEVQPAPFCGDGNRDIPFEACDSETQDAPCGAEPTYFYKKRSCVTTPTAQQPACSWGEFEACRQTGSCGDGILNGPEKCDDAASPPGLCQQCQKANNTKDVSYTVRDTVETIDCLSPKTWAWPGVYAWSYAQGNAEGNGLICGSPPAQKTINGASFYSNKLKWPKEIRRVLWGEGSCNISSNFYLYNKGSQVAGDTGYQTGRVGKHCDHDIVVMHHDFSNVLADEILGNSWYGFGGYVFGTIRVGGTASIKTTDGVVVMENFRSQGGLPSSTYDLTYPEGQGYLIWFGNSSSTNNTEGGKRTSNNNTYVLGCVDIDNNKVCDFTQDV